ncbi:MAG: amidohydrolase family protein [Pseudomonadota bacterium]
MKILKLTAMLLLAGNAAAETFAIHNVTGATPTQDGLLDFSVLVIENGKVLDVGDDGLLDDYPDVRRVDGGGRFLLPGMADAHAHLTDLGFLYAQVDQTGLTSLADAVAAIGAFDDANPGDSWIEGRGWNQVLWDVKEFPSSDDIDAVVADRPVYLKRIDGHAGWANSLAMQLAGIDDDTPDPVGGKIVRDARGKATGVLIDTAMDYVQQKIPSPDKAALRLVYQKAFDNLLPLGITTVHDAGIRLIDVETLVAMADNDEMSVRVYAMILGAGSDLDAIGYPIVAYGDDRLDVRSVKIEYDGALGSRGAALFEPYDDDVENTGLLLLSDDELHAEIEKANGMGFQVSVHAIGDQANRNALDAFAVVQNGKPSPHRNRIEHAQIVSLQDIPRFAELGVIASVQQVHATSDMNMAEDRVGPRRILGGYAWRRLIDSGAIIAGGTDFPIEYPNPFYGMHAAVTRQDRDNLPAGGWYSDQAMTREETLRSVTLDAAYAAHQEYRVGSLERGKWADFIIVDRNYFEIPAEDIHKIQVLETWIGGEKLYDRAEAEQ